MGTTGACGGTHGRGEGGATPAARRTTGRGAAQTEREMLRRCPLFDGMGEADFDAAIRDPQNPAQVLPAYQADHLHPNIAGQRAMAESIDLGLFR